MDSATLQEILDQVPWYEKSRILTSVRCQSPFFQKIIPGLMIMAMNACTIVSVFIALVSGHSRATLEAEIWLNSLVSYTGLPLFHHPRRRSQIHLASATTEAGEDPLPYDSVLRLGSHGSSYVVCVIRDVIRLGEVGS